MTQITDKDFDAGPGGFWVKSDGTLLPVDASTTSHSTTILRNGIPTYRAAFLRGWVRISTYWKDEMAVEFSAEDASVAALQTTAAIIRHPGQPQRDAFSIEPRRFENYGEEPKYRYERFADRAPAANYVMRIALEKNAAEKAATNTPELALAA